MLRPRRHRLTSQKKMRLLLCLSTLVSVVCALAIRAAPKFDDAFSRNKMLALSAAAYTDIPQQCVTNKLSGTVTKETTINCDPSNKDVCAGISGVSDADKAIFIAFRGSTSAIQILMEADESVLQKKVSFVGGGTVSEYFYNGFIGVWNGGMKNDFLQLAQKYPGYQLWITGHSLGGAMASMAASYISTVKLFETAQIRLVTYGEPRVGDADYAAAVDKLPYVFRVTHAHDIVAHIPFQNMGYVHHHTEIWYNNNMATANFKVCDGGDEDKSCSDGQLDLSIEDHLHYYGVEVHEWGTKGCV